METVLNTSIEIHNRNLPNRIVFQPMEGCDGTPSGGIGELTRRRYLRFAQSGAGIIWFEATAVTGEDPVTDPAVLAQCFLVPFKKVTKADL